MGSSQSRFRPTPQDVWPRIKRVSKEPKLLPYVMETMAHVKDPEGVSPIKVAEQLERMIESKAIRPRPRGLASLVRKALEFAVEIGYISRKRDKYVMALDKKGYAIYKNMQATNTLKSPRRKRVKTETRRLQKTAREKQEMKKPKRNASRKERCIVKGMKKNHVRKRGFKTSPPIVEYSDGESTA